MSPIIVRLIATDWKYLVVKLLLNLLLNLSLKDLIFILRNYYKRNSSMFKHLKYIDGTSDKFWEIQTSGSSHTVTYGRNGTDGQSKTKSFDSEDACLKDAEKLINEKTKKGYSEDGTVNVAKQPAKEGALPRKSASAQEKEEVIAALKELIISGKQANVLPFLQSYAKGNLELIKKEIRSAKRFYMTYVDLKNEPAYKMHNTYSWGFRGTTMQIRVIKLLALGTFSLSDASTWTEFVELIDTPKDPLVFDIVDWAKPDWLSDYLQQQFQKNEWLFLDYGNLRFWEDSGLLQHNPEIYANALVNFTSRKREDAKDALIENFLTDELAITRDVPLLFDYDSNINNIYHSYDYSKKTNDLLWHILFAKLLSRGKIDREFLVNGSLEIQTKNWNNQTKSFFRNLILQIELDEDSIIKAQHQVLPLLHSEDTGPVNFAINLLKPILGHPDFDREEFFNWLPPVFMRSDMKGGIKALIIQIDKLLKEYPDFKDQASLLIADTFMISDLQLQERAAKFILKHQANYSDELSDKLNLYSAQMLGAISKDLNITLSTTDTYYTEDDLLATLAGGDSSSYAYAPEESTKLNEEVVLPIDWNDILFQVGQVIHSEDPLDMEILMNAWTLQLPNFPSDYKKQLEPYINKLKNTYSDTCWCQIFSAIFIEHYYNPSKIYFNDNKYANVSHLISLLNPLMELWQRRWKDGIQLVALSLPSHKPFWIAPDILVDRILAYQDAAVEVNLIDFSIALSRTVREGVNGLEKKIELIKDDFIASALSYAFGLIKEIPIKKKGWLSKLIVGKDNKEDAALGVYATIARSNHPLDEFPAFEDTVFGSAVYAVKPLDPKLKLKEVYSSQYNYQTKKQEEVLIGNELDVEFPAFQDYPKTFLFALDIFNRGRNNNLGYSLSTNDVRYAYSLVPQNPDGLAYLYALSFNRMAVWNTKQTKGLLEQMFYPFYIFRDPSALYLATALFNGDKIIRATCVEVFLQTVEQNRLPLDLLSKHLILLMNGDFGPIGRFVEVLEQSKDVSAKHNDAILQLLSLLLQGLVLKDKMPTNFKKVIELFYDLQQKSGQRLNENLRQSIQQFEAYKSLQPLLKKILK